jgi:hypothetical protein
MSTHHAQNIPSNRDVLLISHVLTSMMSDGFVEVRLPTGMDPRFIPLLNYKLLYPVALQLERSYAVLINVETLPQGVSRRGCQAWISPIR